MKKVMVQYKVKAERAEENKRFVQAVFKELNETRPDGIRYATFVQPDGISFVHIASIETEDGSNPLGKSAAFAEFQKEIKERCEIPPQAIEITEVGSYNLF